jgi:hypothetical protein
VRELLQWLQKIIQKSKPSQHSKGNAAVQVGELRGDVTSVHLTQNFYGVAHRPDRAQTSAEHKQVLALLDRVSNRVAVLDFMEREFKTRMVIELTPVELYRLRRYIEVILADASSATRKPRGWRI